MKKIGVLFFDHRNWHAVIYDNHLYKTKDDCGFQEDIPQELLEWFLSEKVNNVRIMFSSEIQRVDMMLPNKISYADGNKLLTNELSNLTGMNPSNFHCSAIRSLSLKARGDDYLLVAAFEHELVGLFRKQIVDFGLIFDGICSLELSFLSYCSHKYNIAHESFIIVGDKYGLAQPANSILEFTDTVSLHEGTKEAQKNYDSWLVKFKKQVRHFGNSGSLYYLVYNDARGLVEISLDMILPDVELIKVDYDEIRHKLAHLAIHSKINTFEQNVSVVNMDPPRKLFSNAYIATPNLLLLLIPIIYCVYSIYFFDSKTKEITSDINKLQPEQIKMDKVKGQKKNLISQIHRIKSTENFIIARRKPLFAFIHISYFFSKYSNRTVLLQSIKDTGYEKIEILGIYRDPEEGLTMNSKLGEFLFDKKMELERSKVDEEFDTENNSILTLDMTINYKGLGK